MVFRPFLKPHRFAPAPLFAAVATASLSALALVAAAPAAYAQEMLTFSGGNGSPLTINLSTPVTYTLTSAIAAGDLPEFLFQGAGNTSNFSASMQFTSVSYTVNGGAARTISYARNGYANNDEAATDMFISTSGFTNTFPALSAGSVIVLSGGTLITNQTIAGAPPATGTYTTFIVDSFGKRISPNGVGPAAGAPEPATLPLLCMGLAGGLGAAHAIKRRKAEVKQTIA